MISAQMAGRGLRPVAELAAGRPHGDRLRYMAGCKCMLCRAANSRYETERAAARRAGDWNGLVPARKAKAHLKKLSRAGVGRNAVSEASGVARSVLAAIRSGKKRQIRKRTETRILNVSSDARMDASIVPAKRAWQLITRLLDEGYTKADLARRLGHKMPALQIRKDFILARTEVAIERLYAQLTR